MSVNIAPTKSNLMKAENALAFSKKGFELLDKKRNVLIREMMGMMNRAKTLQERVTVTFREAYEALQVVNVTMGINSVEEIALSIPKASEYEVLLKSVMGVEIPTVHYNKTDLQTQYGFFRTNPALDIAYAKFKEVKYLIYELAEVENSVYKLAMEIKKTQKRANGLENIQIPKYKEQVKYIQEVLEEKEREDFFRLKRIKKKGQREE
ncbi:V-type ATP synthase subunit D [Geosporobacter ferrireducens]|uniref:V-type ATP synthase subunit D n=1 Tax=Geosporobacter ferrireducens TaxID=1424294 RepID=UPI00139D9174|nr:V-type ATP synthase subunit D [Geosporobacter ferrireducens]MTI53342.1 V-type ATP synthase subunit D [Geosporobacter ferrireducens]